MRSALLALVCAALLAAGPRAVLAQSAQTGSANARPAEAKTDPAANQRPLFLSTDVGLQFTPPPTFIRSVMAARVLTNGRNLECVIAR